MPVLELWQWLLVAACAFQIGIAKTGVPGVGILVVPLMFFVVPDDRLSPGALLPMLCAADLFAVFYYRRHARWDQIWRLSPWVGCGLAIGIAVMLVVSDAVLTPLIGGIILIMIVVHVARQRMSEHAIPKSLATAVVFGVTAGFATMVSNAAGPVMTLYLLSMGLPKDEFMGTGAWFFCIINLLKVPIFVAQGRITGETLALDALVLPAIIIGALSGRTLIAKVNQRIFEWVVLGLATAATILLFFPQIKDYAKHRAQRTVAPTATPTPGP